MCVLGSGMQYLNTTRWIRTDAPWIIGITSPYLEGLLTFFAGMIMYAHLFLSTLFYIFLILVIVNASTFFAHYILVVQEF